MTVEASRSFPLHTQNQPEKRVVLHIGKELTKPKGFLTYAFHSLTQRGSSSRWQWNTLVKKFREDRLSKDVTCITFDKNLDIRFEHILNLFHELKGKSTQSNATVDIDISSVVPTDQEKEQFTKTFQKRFKAEPVFKETDRKMFLVCPYILEVASRVSTARLSQKHVTHVVLQKIGSHLGLKDSISMAHTSKDLKKAVFFENENVIASDYLSNAIKKSKGEKIQIPQKIREIAPKVTSLQITSPVITSADSLDQIAEAFPNLESLDCTFSIDPYGHSPIPLPYTFIQFKNLKELRISLATGKEILPMNMNEIASLLLESLNEENDEQLENIPIPPILKILANKVTSLDFTEDFQPSPHFIRKVIELFPHLENLSLRHANDDLIVLLQQFTKLRSLRLKGISYSLLDITGAHFNTLPQSLEILSISYARVSDQDFQHLNLPNLHTLHIYYSTVEGALLQYISQDVRDIRLAKCSLTDAALGNHFSRFHHLEHVDLSNNRDITGSCFRDFSTTLKTFNFSRCYNLTEQTLLELDMARFTQLEALDFENNRQLRGTFIPKLSPTLKVLRCDNTQVSDVALQDLRKFTKLEELSVYKTDVRKSFLKDLSPTIKKVSLNTKENMRGSEANRTRLIHLEDLYIDGWHFSAHFIWLDLGKKDMQKVLETL